MIALNSRVLNIESYYLFSLKEMIVVKYAGIGSRETPKEVLESMIVLAEFLGRKGFTLRSGGADGADSAFEFGCNKSYGRKEIYLPWLGFNNNPSRLVVQPTAYPIARKFHPRFDSLSQGAQKLQARNAHQVLGLHLNDPVDFIVCYTPAGSGSGGTGQALRMAQRYNIPVFDYGFYPSVEVAQEEFNQFYKRLIGATKA